MKKRRILYFINALPPGGAERQLIYTISGLDRERFEPIVLTLYNENEIPYHYRADLEALKVPIYCLNLARKANPALRFLNGTLRYIWHMWRLRPHIVHGCLHTPNLIARMGRLFSPPHKLITMVQSLYTENELRSERRTAFLSNWTVANSQRTQQHLLKGGVPAHKVMYINCGVNLEHFSANTQPELREQITPGATFVCIMSARIDPRKDHATLLKALGILRNRLPSGFRLIFMGMVGDANTQAHIDVLIQEYDLSRFVVQLPPVHDVAPYYHAADIGLLTSSSEAFGLVIVEAFAAGKPVIASEVGNVLGIVEDDKTGWEFPTGDAQALAALLEKAWSLPLETLHQMGQKAALAAQDFNVERMVEGYMALYEDG